MKRILWVFLILYSFVLHALPPDDIASRGTSLSGQIGSQRILTEDEILAELAAEEATLKRTGQPKDLKLKITIPVTLAFIPNLSKTHGHRLKSLELSNNKIIESISNRHFFRGVFPVEFPVLETLYLTNCSNLKELLIDSPQLKVLYVDGTQIPLAQLRSVLAQAPRMKALSFKNSLAERELQIERSDLQRCTYLELIPLKSCNVGDLEACLIAKLLNPRATSVDLSSNTIGSAGITPLVDKFLETPLQYLCLRSNQINDEGLYTLAPLLKRTSTLTTLDLSCNAIRDQGAEDLASALTFNTSLRNLILSDNPLGNYGVNSILKALGANTRLQNLDLSNSGIDHKFNESSEKKSEENTTLKTLRLSNNRLGTLGVYAAIRFLETCRGLTSLDLSDNNLKTEGAKLVLAALEPTAITDLYLRANDLKTLTLLYIQLAFLERPEIDMRVYCLAGNEIGYEYLLKDLSENPQNPELTRKVRKLIVE
jgi:hypothetical protein